MATEPTTIAVKPESEVASLLEHADRTPLVLVKGGLRYRLEREDIGPDDDPAATRDGMRAVGTWRGMDAEMFKAYIYRARAEGSRPPDRPLPI